MIERVVAAVAGVIVQGDRDARTVSASVMTRLFLRRAAADNVLRAGMSAAGIIAVDQITKYLTRRYIPFNGRVTLIPNFLDLTYVRNTGAAWGIMGGWNSVLALFSLTVVAVMCMYRHHLVREVGAGVVGVVGGGIIGNLLDRLRLGWVTDMIDIHLFQYHWPAFNIADAAICIGVLVYVFRSVRSVSRERRESDEASSDAPGVTG